MKKTILKSSYKLKVFNDGSSAYVWTHPWKGWIPLSSKDLTTSSLWNTKRNSQKLENKTSDLKRYTKSFQ